MSTAHQVPPEPLMTAEEVATYLNVSPSMVYKLRRTRVLPAVQIGSLLRFPPEAVRAYSRGEPPPTGGAPEVPRGRHRPPPEDLQEEDHQDPERPVTMACPLHGPGVRCATCPPVTGPFHPDDAVLAAAADRPYTATDVERDLAAGLARAAAASPPWPPPSVQKWLDDCADLVQKRLDAAGLFSAHLRFTMRALFMTSDELDVADIQRLREDAETYRIQAEGTLLARNRLEQVRVRLARANHHHRWVERIADEIERQTGLYQKATAGYWHCRHEAARLERLRLDREGPLE